VAEPVVTAGAWKRTALRRRAAICMTAVGTRGPLE
jgi:hypothetical protein